MSSLLQFRGQMDREKGVGLEFCQIVREAQYEVDPKTGVSIQTIQADRTDVDTFTCPICGREHAFIWVAWRKPVGMWGCWVVFRYNGRERVPDLSVPISVERIPRGAKKMNVEECAERWHRS